MRDKTYLFFAIIFFALMGVMQASPVREKKSKEKYTRVGIAPVIGFYSLYSKHAINPKARMSFSAFVKREQSMDRSNRLFFSVGFEYFLHGVNYRSYYFNQDTLQLYNGSFDYSYRLYMHELNLPVQAKLAFNSTTNSLFSPYVSIGYHLRYIAATNLIVEQDGNFVNGDRVDMKFRTPFLNNKINSFVGISLGFQSNRTRSSSVTFFAEVQYKYGFSQYSFKQNYSASAVYINSQHLSFNIGVGF